MLLAGMRAGLETIVGHHRERTSIVGPQRDLLCTLPDICRNVNMKEVLASDYANCSIGEILVHGEHRRAAVGQPRTVGLPYPLSGEAAELVSCAARPCGIGKGPLKIPGKRESLALSAANRTNNQTKERNSRSVSEPGYRPVIAACQPQSTG